MLFTSYSFFLFFLGYLLLHCLVPQRLRIFLVIVGSTFFYGYWNPYYVWLPHLLMLIAYLGVLWIEMAKQEQSVRKFRLILTLSTLFLPLLIFKYTNFLFHDVLHLAAPKLLDVPLPLGISFITFTMTAYIVDEYRGKYPIEKHPSMISGLVLFFPHLIAGPILRPQELIPQFKQILKPLSAPFLLGMTLFTVGLLKKLVFADSMAGVVDTVYQSSHVLTKLDYFLALYGFSLQIYCDFSGYTDMALGLALMLGIHLPINFNAPYIATSLVDFWHRWHITLSTWLRDYLYIPLGGNRKGFPRQMLNLTITMLLGGLWHGASWTFVIWGGLHGLGLAVTHSLRYYFPKKTLANTSHPDTVVAVAAENQIMLSPGGESTLAEFSMASPTQVLPSAQTSAHFFSKLRKSASLFSFKLPSWFKILITFQFISLAWVFFRAPNTQSAFNVLSGIFTAPWGDWFSFINLHTFPILLLLIFFLTHRFDTNFNIRKVALLPKYILVPAIVIIWVLAISLSAGSSAKFIYFDF